MTHRSEDPAPVPAPPAHLPPAGAQGFPMWLSILVVIVLLALLSYSVVVIGPEGLPLTYFLGGLLGIYGGGNELLKARDRRNTDRDGGGPP